MITIILVHVIFHFYYEIKNVNQTGIVFWLVTHLQREAKKDIHIFEGCDLAKNENKNSTSQNKTVHYDLLALLYSSVI